MMAAARTLLSNPWRLSVLLQDIAAVSAQQDRDITGLAVDSRRVRPGDLFLACVGQSGRGHEFIPDAVRAGAVAVVYETAPSVAVQSSPSVPLIAVPELGARVGGIASRFYGEPTHDMRVIGVTGTNGKTSCTQFLAQALHSAQRPCGVIGTLGNGLYGGLSVSSHTTPDALSLQALFAQMHEAGARSVAMEVSSHGLDQGRVNGVLFDTVVFTNLTRDHLDYHGDMRAYGEAKRRLFHFPGLRRAVINTDDDFGRELLADLPADVQAVSYSLNGDRAIPAVRGIQRVAGTIVSLDRHGLVLQARTPWGEGRIETRLLGRFNASNVLAVLATLLAMEVPFSEAAARVRQLQPVPGRMECYGGRDGRPLVIIDYAHTPDALQHVLQAARDYTQGVLWCVFGCGGDRDRGKRPIMGACAEEYADLIIVTDDNPRRENPDGIIANILAGMSEPKLAHVERDRARAIAHAVRQADERDVVVIAGKGHEDYQIIGEQKLPFSDSAQVLSVLQERGV